MVADPDGDAGPVDDGADVVGVDALDREGDDGGLVFGGAVDFQALDGAQALGRIGQQVLLVGRDGFQKRWGGSLKVVPLKETRSIISPPPW